MGLTDALFTGTSGLKSLGHGMSVIGDNVSNLNTTAFKGARISFQDVIAQRLNTAAGSGYLGGGASVQTLYPAFGQGSLESTASPTDLAIAGKGFFLTREPDSNGKIFYTRDGQFTVDKNGYLVNPVGFRVQGWRIDEETEDLVGALTDIQIERHSAPVATNKIEVITNLDAREEPDPISINLRGNVSNGSVNRTLVIRDLNGLDQKIFVDLSYNANEEKWDYRIRENDSSGTILAEGTGVTNTRATIELPSTGENIIIDWSALTHDSQASNNLSAPGRAGRVEISGSIHNNTWTYTGFSLEDANGTVRNLRLWLRYDSHDNRWDYYIVENPNDPAPQDPHGENGTILARGEKVNETSAYFFLDGTTQRVTIDWSSVVSGGGGSMGAQTYTLQEIPTLLDHWDAQKETPLPSSEYTYRTTLTVYDSLGTPHEITVYYDRTSRDNVYEFLVVCDPNEDQRNFVRALEYGKMPQENEGTPMYWRRQEGGVEEQKWIQSANTMLRKRKGVLMYGRIEFDNQGNLKKFYETYRIDPDTGKLVRIIDERGNPIDNPEDGFDVFGENNYPLFIADFLGLSLDQGTEGQDTIQKIELNKGYYYSSSDEQWKGESVRTTQYATSSSTIFYDQNGFGPGYLESVSVNTYGVIRGHYSNGRVIPLWMVALASFNVPEKLEKVGGNLFRESIHSGPPLTGRPGTNGLGSIAPNSLEQSNVDLGEQFVKMITFQRGFQADARIITVTDTMLDELINLKR